MIPKSPYDVLGVSRNADAATIRAAYRRLAKLHHPDIAKGSKDAAAERFRKVQEAYEVLSNAQKRAKYDEQLAAEAKASEQSAAEAQGSSGWVHEPWSPQPETAGAKVKRSPGYKRNHAAWLIPVALVAMDVVAMNAWPALRVPLMIALVVLVLAIKWEPDLNDVGPVPEPEFQWKRPPPTTRAQAIARKLSDACAYVALGIIGLMLAGTAGIATLVLTAGMMK